jgi:hypothetical protein
LPRFDSWGQPQLDTPKRRPLVPPDLQFMLGEMNAKLDTLIQRTNEDRKTTARLEARVARLEAWRWVLTGAATMLGGGAGYLVKLFGPR